MTLYSTLTQSLPLMEFQIADDGYKSGAVSSDEDRIRTMEYLEIIFEALPQWAWIGALLARVSVGLLFAFSGGSKLFIPARKEKMRETMSHAGLPLPNLTAVVISLVEFVFGSLLVIGFLTLLCCLILVGVMVGALITVVVPGMKEKSFIDWLGDFLYLPEVLYLVILIWLFFAGPGWLSVDHLLLAG